MEGGSLNGRIGWFPSTFVGIVNAAASATTNNGSANMFRRSDNSDPQLETRRLAYRSDQIKNFIAKERETQQKIQQLQITLNALEVDGKTSRYKEFTLITKSIEDFITLKHSVLKQLEEEINKPLNYQFIGRIFLDVAIEVKTILYDYCRKHCDLLDLLNLDSSNIQQQISVWNINLKELVAGLSLVFRHVDKYASNLQEVERNTPDGHPDKGNLHRAASVYRDFYNECEKIRRQREAQIDFIRTGILEELYGVEFEHSLGSFLYIGKVTATESSTADEASEVDRCIAVFERIILLLEMHTSSGKNMVKNRFLTNDLLMQMRDLNNEIRIRISEKKPYLTLKSIGKDDYKQLLEALKLCDGLKLCNEDGFTQTTKEIDNGRGCSTEKEHKRYEKTNVDEQDGGAVTFSGNIRLNHQLEMILPENVNENELLASPSKIIENKPYSGWSLRPHPPQRAEWHSNSQPGRIKMRKGLSIEEQEDALMLKIIEGYCTSGTNASPSAPPSHYCNGRIRKPPYQQRNSAESCHSPYGGGQVRRAASYPDQHEISSRPQLIVAEDEKLFVEEMEGDKLIVKERSLVDTVYALKDQMSVLTKEVGNISKALEQEQRARRRMEELIRQTEGPSSATNPNGPKTNQENDVNPH